MTKDFIITASASRAGIAVAVAVIVAACMMSIRSDVARSRKLLDDIACSLEPVAEQLQHIEQRLLQP